MFVVAVAPFDEEDVRHPYVERVITEFWNDLAEHRYGAIAQALNAEYDAVVEVREFIREHLRPYPLALSGEGSARTNYIMPDVIIRENEGKLEAEVLMSDRSFCGLIRYINRWSNVGAKLRLKCLPKIAIILVSMWHVLKCS